MARSVSGRRPGSETHNHMTRDIRPQGQCPACDAYRQSTEDETYTARAMRDKVMTFGFDSDRAARIVSIAGTYGVKAEAIADGMITVRSSPGGYTLEVQR
jgi:hypothetical protein